MRIVATELAADQIRTVAAWWVENRPASPDLFVQELDHALDLIENQPALGPRAGNVELPDVRRVVLRRSRYHFSWQLVAILDRAGFRIGQIEDRMSVDAIYPCVRT